MALEVINVGSAPNDGTGDPLRTAYIKTNNNFGELYSRAQTNPPDSLTGSLGDVAGMYAYDENYFYYCYQDFDGTSQIWNQVAQIGNISVTQIASGNSSVEFSDISGNVLFSVDGTDNVMVVTSNSATVTGNLTTTNRITGGNLYSLGLVSSIGTVTAPFFVGNGAFLTGIDVGNSTYSNSNVASYLPTYTGSFPSLSGNVTTDGNLTGAQIYGNGRALTGMYGNANVAVYLSGSVGNIIPSANVTYSLGNSTNQWKDLWVSNSTIYINSVPVTVSGNTLQVNGQAVLSNGSSSAVSTTGNVSAANVLTGGLVSATGAITGAAISGTTISGSGNVTGANVLTGGQISASGNITGNFIYGNGSSLTGIAATTVGTLVSLSVTGNTQSGNLLTNGQVSATGNISGGNILTGGLISSTGTITGSSILGSVLSTSGNVTGGNILTSGLISATSTITSAANIAGGNILTGGLISSTGTITGSSILGSVLSTSGNVTGGNILTSGLISANGSIIGAVIAGTTISGSGNVTGANVLTGGLISATGSITGGAISGTTVSGSGNVTGANVLTGGLISATGNITGGNLNTGARVVATGNITGGNILTSGIVSATANITASYFIGNGSALTGLTGTIIGTVPSGNVTYTAPYTGSVQRTGQSKYSDMVSVKDFGAVGDGITDDRAAIQAAIDTTLRVYVPTGTYRLGSALGCYYPGQIISGDGRTKSVFLADDVNYDFNLADTAVLVFTPSEPGPTLRDIGIQFVQPVTSNRASLINYPPAIYAQAVPRFTIQNCRITNGMTGIDMRQNSGGATIDGLEMSCYNYGVRIDGSLDTVRILRLQYWPFEIAGTANESIFFDSTNRGIVSGRCDDLKINGCLFINGGIQIELQTTASGTTFGAITDTDFDNFASYNQTGGTMTIMGCYFTIGNGAYNPITLAGTGYLRVQACEFSAAVSVTNAFIQQSGGSFIQVSACTFRNSAIGGGYFNMNAGTSIITGCQFIVPANLAFLNPLIAIAGGRTTFVSNRCTDKGTGASNLIAVVNNNWHVITNNAGVGWGFSYPGTTTQMVIANNS